MDHPTKPLSRGLGFLAYYIGDIYRISQDWEKIQGLRMRILTIAKKLEDSIYYIKLIMKEKSLRKYD